MKTMKQSIFIFTLSLVVLSVSACSGVFSKPTAPPTATQPPTATATDLPTHTPSPTPAATATITPTASLTLTPTANVGTDFSQAKVLLHGKTPNWNYFMTLQLPGQPKGAFYAMVDQNKIYTCTLSSKFTNRLTCTGQMAAYDDYVDFVLYVTGYNTPLYKTRIFIPADLN